MYLDYWKLNKRPFDSVPDPEMYFDMHQSVDDSVSELLYAIEEGNECLAVAVGEVGVGKTMCLRIVLNSLDKNKYRIAFVTNPDMTFPQLLREIIGQLEGEECSEQRKDRLFEHFNKLLFQTSDAGKKTVVFIDEGNVIRPHNLESLRLLTNMQDDNQNLFTIVLAGQPELARRLEDPRRQNLFQRIGVYCKIQGIRSRETMTDYIEHRLERAGWSGESPFTAEAYDALWELSEHGVPRLINKMCKLSLKAAETNGLQKIDADVVKAVGERFVRTYWRIHKTVPKKVEVQEPAAVEEPVVAMEPEKVVEPALEVKVAAEPARQEDLEKMASELATEEVKQQTRVVDPFEAWNKAREEILQRLHGAGPEPALALKRAV